MDITLHYKFNSVSVLKVLQDLFGAVKYFTNIVQIKFLSNCLTKNFVSYINL